MVIGKRTMDIVGSLNLIKECTSVILHEIDSLKQIKKANMSHLDTYSKAIKLLSDSIERIITIFHCNFIQDAEHVHLKLLMVDFLSLRVLQFQEHIKEYKEWVSNISTGNCLSRACGLLCSPPSKQHAKLQTAFMQCYESMKEMIELEGTLLGSAMRIKHPILRRVWVETGQNDINASEIPVGFVQETLLKMLRLELKILKNEQYCRDMIKALVTRLDGSLGSLPDGKLSMTELNEAAKFPKDSVAALLGISVEAQPDENMIEVLCEVQFEGPIHASNQCGFAIPAVKGRYGADWQNVKVASICVPKLEDTLFGIKVFVEGNDQNWGNTNQVQIAYHVDKGEPDIITQWGLNFDHDKVKDEKYSFVIPATSLVEGVSNNITLFMFVPPWSGFSGKVTSVKAVCVTQKKAKQQASETVEQVEVEKQVKWFSCVP